MIHQGMCIIHTHIHIYIHTVDKPYRSHTYKQTHTHTYTTRTKRHAQALQGIISAPEITNLNWHNIASSDWPHPGTPYRNSGNVCHSDGDGPAHKLVKKASARTISDAKECANIVRACLAGMEDFLARVKNVRTTLGQPVFLLRFAPRLIVACGTPIAMLPFFRPRLILEQVRGCMCVLLYVCMYGYLYVYACKCVNVWSVLACMYVCMYVV